MQILTAISAKLLGLFIILTAFWPVATGAAVAKGLLLVAALAGGGGLLLANVICPG